MDILSGCVDFQLEADHSSSKHSHVCVRYGSLFRLRLFFNKASNDGFPAEAREATPAVQGFLEMVAPGSKSLH